MSNVCFRMLKISFDDVCQRWITTIVEEPDEESAIENIPLTWDSPYTRRYLVCPMYVAGRQEY